MRPSEVTSRKNRLAKKLLGLSLQVLNFGGLRERQRSSLTAGQSYSHFNHGEATSWRCYKSDANLEPMQLVINCAWHQVIQC